ncbi:hypothetical protein BOX15_Mlig015865g1, partial [Macrostomum lignano]
CRSVSANKLELSLSTAIKKADSATMSSEANEHPVSHDHHKQQQLAAMDGPAAVPRPIQIVTATYGEDGKGKFDLDLPALEQLLLNDRIRDHRVAVVSVAGAFRKGKSFLLNYFLRYLACISDTDGGGLAGSCGTEDWLGSSSQPLRGFSWRGGSERDTTGILLWSEPFLVTLAGGEKVAVLLMDTQGAFDSQSTVRDCATVFALSTMLSSVQIYNLSTNIQEDDLQHLQLFTEYGKLAQESLESAGAPFQHLLFLVRDWSYPYEHGFGEEGGRALLEKRLLINDKQHHELQQLRRHIRQCFDDISCFLLPHPGLDVATDPTFDGRLSAIHPQFVAQLRLLVPRLLAPANLVVKRINGADVTCQELLHYFKAYMPIYQGDDLPQPKTMLMATAEANNLAAVAASRTVYTGLMEEVCGGERPYVAPDKLLDEHRRCVDDSLVWFRKLRKMGGPEFSAQYEEQLSLDCDEAFEMYRAHNQSKNVYVGMRTLSVLFSALLLCYFLAGFLDFIGLDPLANLCTWMVWVLIVALITWCYVRHSGNYLDLGHHIDAFANLLWDKIGCPLYVTVTQKAAEQAVGFNMAGRQRQRSSSSSSAVPAVGRPKRD